jgi:hypothetical protein
MECLISAVPFLSPRITLATFSDIATYASFVTLPTTTLLMNVLIARFLLFASSNPIPIPITLSSESDSSTYKPGHKPQPFQQNPTMPPARVPLAPMPLSDIIALLSILYAAIKPIIPLLTAILALLVVLAVSTRRSLYQSTIVLCPLLMFTCMHWVLGIAFHLKAYFYGFVLVLLLAFCYR